MNPSVKLFLIDRCGSIIDVIGHRQSYVRKGTLMITCDDYVLGTYVCT